MDPVGAPDQTKTTTMTEPSIDQRVYKGTSSGLSYRIGFTLIELLATITIIGLITAATAPLLFETMKGNRLTGAGESIASRISMAHQMATARNREVELRFYSYVDEGEIGNEENFRATLIAAPALDPTAGPGSMILSDLAHLKSGIVIAGTSSMSPIFSDSSRDFESDPETKINGSSGKYKSIRFFPDGSCDLTSVTNESYITLADANSISGGDVPPNFYCIRIDKYTSRTTIYRPN